MTYGVLASKPAQAQVEKVDPTAGSDDHARSRRPGHRPARHRGAGWSDGRITLTSRHLSFIPVGDATEVPALTLALGDILLAETSTGALRKVVTILTSDLVLRLRVSGASGFAQQVSTSVESARKRRDDDPPVDTDDPLD